ncbi:hypothetical protein D9C73_020354 [Collichthys lucidus]|uniref:Uncharacterized protein n=1 Tax=Collichthys lucidus TaxID=240159 RepID=A0A4U5VDM5_COLLU|nr:hypothetical protein D9C73_020354 [Collichthys lucidus]
MTDRCIDKQSWPVVYSWIGKNICRLHVQTWFFELLVSDSDINVIHGFEIFDPTCGNFRFINYVCALMLSAEMNPQVIPAGYPASWLQTVERTSFVPQFAARHPAELWYQNSIGIGSYPNSGIRIGLDVKICNSVHPLFKPGTFLYEAQ